MENITRYYTLDTFIDRAINGASDCPDNSRASRSDSRNKSWTLGINFPEAAGLATSGWSDGAERVRSITDRLLNRLPQVFDGPDSVIPSCEGGAWIDIGDYVSGEPEHFRDFAGNEGQRKPIELLIHAGMLASVEGNDALNRGAAVCALVEAMAVRGYRCGITVCSANAANYGTGPVYCQEIRIKEPGQNVSTDTLAFVLAHPAFFRRLGFSCMECEPKNPIRDFWGFGRDTKSGYGSTSDYPEPGREGRVYFGPVRCDGRFSTEENALAWLLETAAANGVPLTPDPA